MSWRGISAECVELGDAVKDAAAVCDGGFVAKDGWTFEVEDAESGEVVLNQINQIVDRLHG